MEDAQEQRRRREFEEKKRRRMSLAAAMGAQAFAQKDQRTFFAVDGRQYAGPDMKKFERDLARAISPPTQGRSSLQEPGSPLDILSSPTPSTSPEGTTGEDKKHRSFLLEHNQQPFRGSVATGGNRVPSARRGSLAATAAVAMTMGHLMSEGEDDDETGDGEGNEEEGGTESASSGTSKEDARKRTASIAASTRAKFSAQSRRFRSMDIGAEVLAKKMESTKELQMSLGMEDQDAGLGESSGQTVEEQCRSQEHQAAFFMDSYGKVYDQKYRELRGEDWMRQLWTSSLYSPEADLLLQGRMLGWPHPDGPEKSVPPPRYTNLPSPNLFDSYDDYQQALLEWRADVVSALGYLQLPEVMGICLSRPSTGVPPVEMPDADSQYQPEMPTQGLSYREWLKRDLLVPWEAQLVPPEPDPHLYLTYEDYEEALGNWALCCMKNLRLIPPHPRQLEELCGLKPVRVSKSSADTNLGDSMAKALRFRFTPESVFERYFPRQSRNLWDVLSESARNFISEALMNWCQRTELLFPCAVPRRATSVAEQDQYLELYATELAKQVHSRSPAEATTQVVGRELGKQLSEMGNVLSPIEYFRVQGGKEDVVPHTPALEVQLTTYGRRMSRHRRNTLHSLSSVDLGVRSRNAHEEPTLAPTVTSRYPHQEAVRETTKHPCPGPYDLDQVHPECFHLTNYTTLVRLAIGELDGSYQRLAWSEFSDSFTPDQMVEEYLKLTRSLNACTFPLRPDQIVSIVAHNPLPLYIMARWLCEPCSLNVQGIPELHNVDLFDVHGDNSRLRNYHVLVASLQGPGWDGRTSVNGKDQSVFSLLVREATVVPSILAHTKMAYFVSQCFLRSECAKVHLNRALLDYDFEVLKYLGECLTYADRLRPSHYEYPENAEEVLLACKGMEDVDPLVAIKFVHQVVFLHYVETLTVSMDDGMFSYAVLTPVLNNHRTRIVSEILESWEENCVLLERMWNGICHNRKKISELWALVASTCIRLLSAEFSERNPNFMLICLRGIRDIGRSKFEHSRSYQKLLFHQLSSGTCRRMMVHCFVNPENVLSDLVDTTESDKIGTRCLYSTLVSEFLRSLLENVGSEEGKSFMERLVQDRFVQRSVKVVYDAAQNLGVSNQVARGCELLMGLVACTAKPLWKAWKYNQNPELVSSGDMNFPLVLCELSDEDLEHLMELVDSNNLLPPAVRTSG